MTMPAICAEEIETAAADTRAHAGLSKPFMSLYARLLVRFANYLENREQRRTDREAFKQMLTLDDDILRDIGVTRDDVYWASRLPIEVNASQALEEAKRYGRN